MVKFIEAEKVLAEIKRRMDALPEDWIGAPAASDAYRDATEIILDIQNEQTEAVKEEGGIRFWLAFFGMPADNVERCATQIAQGYGAIRFLEGVQSGAAAVTELKDNERTPHNLD